MVVIWAMGISMSVSMAPTPLLWSNLLCLQNLPLSLQILLLSLHFSLLFPRLLNFFIDLRNRLRRLHQHHFSWLHLLLLGDDILHSADLRPVSKGAIYEGVGIELAAGAFWVLEEEEEGEEGCECFLEEGVRSWCGLLNWGFGGAFVEDIVNVFFIQFLVTLKCLYLYWVVVIWDIEIWLTNLIHVGIPSTRRYLSLLVV